MAAKTATSKGSARRGAPRQITANEIAEMKRLRANGLTYEQIGKELKRHPSLVWRHVGEVPTKAAPRRVSAAERQFIIEHVRDGWSQAAIAEALGRSNVTISAVVRSEGIAYQSQKVGRGSATPRIAKNGRPLGVDPELRRRIVSAARRTGTLAGTARAVGVTEKVAEQVLQEDAPVVLFAYVRRNVTSPGGGIERFAGETAAIVAYWRQLELDTRQGYDEIVEDFGADKVRDWLERLERDRQAIRDLTRELRHALERAGDSS